MDNNVDEELKALLKQISDNQSQQISLLEKSLALQTESFLMMREQHNKSIGSEED